MKKSEVVKAFLEQNNIEGADVNPQIHAAYQQACPEYSCSFQYFKNIATGKFDNQSNQDLSDIPAMARPNIQAPIFSGVTTDPIPEDFETKKVAEINFDSSILTPVKTDTILDNIISYSGGFMPATIMMMPGESGVGKTTLAVQMLGMVKRANPESDILFVSSEMNQIHIYKYKQRVKFDELEVCMLSESDYPQEELEKILSKGWDIVLLDSLADTINKVREQKGISEKQAESYMLKLMDKTRRGENEKGKYTTFICTHHMTKGGTYTGSTNLKHMTDAMMNLLQCEDNEDKAYIVFSKNRDGKKGVRLYYSITHDGVVFDEERFHADEDARTKTRRAAQILKDKNENFASIFGLGDKNTEKVDDVDDVDNLDALSGEVPFEGVELVETQNLVTLEDQIEVYEAEILEVEMLEVE